MGICPPQAGGGCHPGGLDSGRTGSSSKWIVRPDISRARKTIGYWRYVLVTREDVIVTSSALSSWESEERACATVRLGKFIEPFGDLRTLLLAVVLSPFSTVPAVNWSIDTCYKLFFGMHYVFAPPVGTWCLYNWNLVLTFKHFDVCL